MKKMTGRILWLAAAAVAAAGIAMIIVLRMVSIS